jgi:predicted Zn finger-like uncharacterized protein
MRLICPNCDAQYEVVDEVIPTEGRDVQCSNCGQTWYQHHPDYMPETAEPGEEPDDLIEPDDAPAQDEERAPSPEPQRRDLDPSVADILRQEAELESKARASQSGGLESQPDLGLDTTESETDRRAREARERMARMRGEDPAPKQVSEAAAAAAALGSRRDLLPDIEEINSTLRSTSDRQSGTPAEPGPVTDARPAGKSSFRRGFTLMLLLAVILAALYAFAPQIARSVPQVDPYLSAFVAQVDTARSWLDGQVARLLTWLDAVASAQNDG